MMRSYWKSTIGNFNTSIDSFNPLLVCISTEDNWRKICNSFPKSIIIQPRYNSNQIIQILTDINNRYNPVSRK